MASSEILQEYLIKVGYKTDISSLKKLQTGLSDTSKKILAIGGTAIAAIGAMEVATSAFAFSMRDMFFQSKLSGSTVKNIMSIGTASKSVGVDSDTMAASIKRLGISLKTNPGLQGFVEALGVTVEGRDTSDVILDLVKASKEYGPAIGAQLAAQFGLDTETFLLLADGIDKINKKKAENNKLFSDLGYDPKKSQQDVEQYTERLDKLGLTFDIVSSKILSSLLPAFNSVADFFSDAMGGLNDYLSGIKDSIGFTEGLSNVVNRISSPRIKSKARTHGKGIEETPVTGQTVLGKLAGGAADVALSASNKAHDFTVEKMQQGKNIANKAVNQAKLTAEDVVDFFMKKGRTKEQSIGIAANLQQESGFNPSAVGDKGQAFGLAQFHKDRQQNFKKLFGKDIKESTGQEQLEFIHHEMTKGTEQAAGRKLSKETTSAGAAASISKNFERPADREGEVFKRSQIAIALEKTLPKNQARAEPTTQPESITQTRLGNTTNQIAPQMNQTTNINVTGQGAESTAKAVAREQTRVNADITRNMKGALA